MDFNLDPQEIEWHEVRRFGVFSAVVLLLLSLFCFLYQSLIVPLGISLFLTFVLLPLVDALDRSSRLPRSVIVAAIVLFTVALLAFASIRVLPALYHEIGGLLALAPKVYDTVMKTWLPSVSRFVLTWGVLSPEDIEQVVRELRTIAHFSARVNQALTTIWDTAPQVVGTLVNMVMVPLCSFFFLKDFNIWKQRLLLLIPRDLETATVVLAGRISRTLRAVIRGQVTVAAILALLYVLGLNIIGLHAALAIGLVAGVCRVIPYLDVLVGGLLSLLVIFADFQGPGQLLAVGVVFFTVQALDGMLITPRVIGVRVGLHPLAVIVSVLAFGDLFGFWGILLAIPAVAVAKVLWLSFKPFYLASRAYKLPGSP